MPWYLSTLIGIIVTPLLSPKRDIIIKDGSKALEVRKPVNGKRRKNNMRQCDVNL